MKRDAEPAGLDALKQEVLALVGALPPAAALAALDDIYAETAPGLARRALLAARITLMKAGVVAAAPEPEPAEEEVVVTIAAEDPPPPPAPPALKPGRFKMVSLEDATRFLDQPAEPELPPAPVLPDPEPEAVAEPEVVVTPTADFDQAAEFAPVRILPDPEQALPDDTPVIEPDLDIAAAPKKRKKTASAVGDAAALFNALADDGDAAPNQPAPDDTPVIEPDLDIATPKKRKKTASAVEDAAALFSALADDGDAAPVVAVVAESLPEPAPEITSEPGAEPAPPAPKKKVGKMRGALADGGLAEMAALLAADPEPVAADTTAKPPAIDLSAQFAAMASPKES